MLECSSNLDVDCLGCAGRHHLCQPPWHDEAVSGRPCTVEDQQSWHGAFKAQSLLWFQLAQMVTWLVWNYDSWQVNDVCPVVLSEGGLGGYFHPHCAAQPWPGTSCFHGVLLDHSHLQDTAVGINMEHSTRHYTEMPQELLSSWTTTGPLSQNSLIMVASSSF